MQRSLMARNVASCSSMRTWLDQIVETQAPLRQDGAQPLEGQLDLFLGAFGHGAVGPNADLAGDEEQAARLHRRRVLKQVEDLVATEGRMILGKAQTLDAAHDG